MDFVTVITYLKDLFATIMILLTMFSPAFGGNGVAYEAEKPDELITSFVVVSDIHVETNNPASYQNLNDVLYGIKAGKDIDTVVYTGDNVMNGQLLENFFFYTALRAVNPAENNLVVAGNHDLGNGEGNVPELLDNFVLNNKLYLDSDVGKDGYYYRVIDGCYMVVLISEDPTSEDFMMGQAQYDWLEGVLKEAQTADAPVIVFNHFPLRYLDGTSEIHHNKLGALLQQYDVELYIHGHIHNDMGADNFYTSYVDSINLCRTTETTDYDAGDGIVVEVYEDEILVRARDFNDGEWIEGLEYRYPIG